MNLVGKIFTVLIFLMCVVFGTFAVMVNAAHKNWMTEVAKLDRQLQEASKVNTNLKAEKKATEDELAQEKLDEQKRNIALEQHSRDIKDELDRKLKELDTAETANRALVQEINAASLHINVLQPEVERLQQDRNKAVNDRDVVQKQLVQTNDDLMNSVNERNRLQKLQAVLAQQILDLKSYVAYTKGDLQNFQKTSALLTTGEVVAVPRPNVIEISLGADDGVRVGHKFVVTRPSTGKYIGIIDVIQADDPRRSVCRPEQPTLNDQIQRGDRVQPYVPKAH